MTPHLHGRQDGASYSIVLWVLRKLPPKLPPSNISRNQSLSLAECLANLGASETIWACGLKTYKVIHNGGRRLSLALTLQNTYVSGARDFLGLGLGLPVCEAQVTMFSFSGETKCLGLWV